MSELKIVVTGASGRMGRTLIREIAQGHGITLCGALEMEGHPNLGLDSGTLAGMQPNGITLTADPLPLVERLAFTDATRAVEWHHTGVRLDMLVRAPAGWLHVPLNDERSMQP